ncbi:MAG: hypothetical protein AMXMBFR64_43560 [Myxococcales bacterium]
MKCDQCGGTMAPLGRFWFCGDCGSKAEAAPVEREPQGDTGTDLDALPFPVAYPLAHARDAGLSAGERVHNAIFAAYQTMRMATLLMLAEYLEDDTVEPSLAAPIRGLQLPHWSEWTTLAGALVRFGRGELSVKPAGDALFGAVREGWAEVDRGRRPKGEDPWAPLLEGLPGSQGMARSANDAVWTLRNERAHRLGTRVTGDEGEAALLGRLLPLVERMAATVFPAGAVTLIRRVEPDGVIRLVGPHADGRFLAEDATAPLAGLLRRAPVAALVGDRGIPVHPLFVTLDADAADAPLAGAGLLEDAETGMVDGVTDKRVVILGVRRVARLPALAPEVGARLRSKLVELGRKKEDTHRWTVGEYAALTARQTLDEVRGRKYLPQCYVERQGVDDALLAALEQPGAAVLVLGEAGSGKSSLLARLVESLLEHGDHAAPPGKRRGSEVERYLATRGAGDVVVFLQGRQAYASAAGAPLAAALCDAVLVRLGVCPGEFADLGALLAQLGATAGRDTDAGRRVILVLDALNEADSFTDLMKALDQALPHVARHPWARLVVSLRQGAWASLVAAHRRAGLAGASPLEYARHLCRFQDPESTEEQEALALRPFTPEEAARAFAARRERLPQRSARLRWEQLGPELQHLLCSPLHLHLFHETWRGQDEVPPVVGERSLFDAYLDALAAELPGLGDTLAAVGRLLYDERRPDVPLDRALAWLDHWRAGRRPADLVARLDPIEELVAASVLLRPAEEGIGTDRSLVGYTFTHQRLCEQVLLRELERRMSPRELPTAEELLAWADLAEGDAGQAPFVELAGALEILAVRLVEAGEGGPLARLVSDEGHPVRAQVVSAGMTGLGPSRGLGASSLPAPLTSLAPLRQAALQSPDHAKWLDDAIWQERRRLEQTGASVAAEQVSLMLAEVLRAAVDASPDRADLQRDLSVSLNNLGNLARAAGRSDEARDFFQESLDVMRRLVQREPHRADLQRELSVSLNNLGNLARAAGRSDEARDFFQESLDVMRRLVQREPHRADLRVDLAISCWNFYLLSVGAAEERRWLVACLGELRVLRDAGLQHGQLEQLWGLATSALAGLGPVVE